MSKHNAPAVVYPVPATRVLARVATLIWLASASVVGMWFYSANITGWRGALGWCALALSAVGVWASLRESVKGQLMWDGDQWQWQAPDKPVMNFVAAPGVVMDVQFALLLCWDTTGVSRKWLWVMRSAQPERWLDLRRAVYAAVRGASASLKQTGAHIEAHAPKAFKP